MKPLIAVFAKAPQAGRVKTRLVPPLSAEQAARLHERLVGEVWARVRELAAVADCELHVSGETDAWPEAAPRRRQSPGDLGARMLHALEQGLTGGHPRVAIVGGDIPQLPLEAVLALLAADSDVALGPARDGGYYAICCRRTHAAMFAGVRWSTPHALADTIAACARLGFTISIGQPWHDVDTAEDLHLLPPHLRP